MLHLPFDVWVLIAQNLGEEAITLADAIRGGLYPGENAHTLADAVYEVSENVYLARWEMLPELEC